MIVALEAYSVASNASYASPRAAWGTELALHSTWHNSCSTAVPGHSSTKLTYADYIRFPDDGLRHEIIEGKHYVTPSPATRHQRILGNLYHSLRNYLDTHAVGEVFLSPYDVVLSDINVFVPDLIYVSN